MKIVERHKAMLKEDLVEIREILEGARSGELLYDQTRYHNNIAPCRTSHCIAGHKAHRDAESAGYGPLTYEVYFIGFDGRETFQSSELNSFLESNGFLFGDCWSYAKQSWGLSVDEAYELFRVEATLSEQFSILELLEDDKTVL